MSKTNFHITAVPKSNSVFFKHNQKGFTFFFIGKNSTDAKLKTAFEKEWNAEITEQFFEKNGIVSIGLIENSNYQHFDNELEVIKLKIDLEQPHLAVLVNYKDPSIERSQVSLPAEESFLISPKLFFQFYKDGISSGLCYHFMLHALVKKSGVEQIIIHQIAHPNNQRSEYPKGEISVEVVIPHRGNSDDLETALCYLEKQKTQPKKISVCFDEEVEERHFEMLENHQNKRFFINYPFGAGPYPSRDVLARATEEDIIMFHDSDDICTSNRTFMLINYLQKNNLDAVGSHELRVDKIQKKVVAVRFPLKVTEAMGDQGKHSIFFPTTAIKKTAYIKAGGLSNVRKHSSDSQFYKRAYFFLDIENVDEFLYIRVKHENSLTTAKKTALGSLVRQRLIAQWSNDFVRVYNQNINLLESTLIDETNNIKVDVFPLSTTNKETILTWQSLNNTLKVHNLSEQITNTDFPNAQEIRKDRLLDYKLVKDPGVYVLKKSLSWRIGWAITRLIKALLGWIPFVKKRM